MYPSTSSDQSQQPKDGPSDTARSITTTNPAPVSSPEPSFHAGATLPDVVSSTAPPETGPPDFHHRVEVHTPQPLGFVPTPRVIISPKPERPVTSSTETAPILSRQNTIFRPDDGPYRTSAYTSTRTPPNRESRRMASGHDQTLDRKSSRNFPATELDYIVPHDEKSVYREKTVAERLQPTMENAAIERKKHARKALWTGYALNAAIGLQIVLGTLTTALSVVTTGKQTATMTAVLGGFSTVVASYLARARGTGEPEISTSRVKDLEQFIRECEAFMLDHGHVAGNRFNDQLDKFRRRFEELLGNTTEAGKLSTSV